MVDTEFDPTSNFFTAFRKDFSFVDFHREEAIYWFRTYGLWGVSISYILCVLFFTTLIAFLGTRGYSRWRVALKMIISLSIGSCIIVCVTGTTWQVCEYQYEERSPGLVSHYQLNIGLRSANISLHQFNQTNDKTLEYHNVKIEWIEVDQAEKEYRAAQMAGWPAGLLKIAMYISVDQGGMRYMREFRWSGYVTLILLWAAFATWLLANVLFAANITYAALTLLLTGLLQVISCIVYGRETATSFSMPLRSGEQVVLRFGWMFWFTLFVGLFVVTLSIVIYVLNVIRPKDMNKFFSTQSEYVAPFDDMAYEAKNLNVKTALMKKLSGTRDKRTSEVENGKTHLLDESPGPSYGSNQGVDNAGFEMTPKERPSTLNCGPVHDSSHSDDSMINKIDECLDEDSDHDPIESCDDYSTDDGLDHDDHHDSLDHDDHHDSLDHDDHRRNSNAPIITITSET